MTPTADRPSESRTVSYATPAARKTPPWVWWLLGGLGAVVLLMLVLLVLGVVFYSLVRAPSATPATTGGPAPATAPAGGGG
jgi:hypothetical protein